ncbi:hypothetical protein ONS95_013868 [Cadophora gregata]|uniref:uncharacterized protein n=1 Tax=Cadophora gregata TaxID=51156 RepID=UPI0026DBB1E7|nr:uncharacterized protein ONS95_013868 [Cadophora gregata]KAK0113623.1 hypothetical protein ONS96_014478 [Cadophora gregata f. sp. sojae]KAK0114376.1 hypothetical protein ONS95_013868 [Cadophora gregata]
MSTSDARQRRSRLIAEMSRNIKLNDLSITSSIASKRNDRSFASSTGSKHGTISSSSTGSRHGTVSADSTRSTDFDPERDEALVSTQRMDFDVSQKLPQIRDTARKYGRWAPRRAEDFKINTSAIGRAFPDFTQGDTDMSLSIEQPRPHHTTKQSLDDSPLASINNGTRLRGSPRKPRPQSPILEALGRKENKEVAASKPTTQTVIRKENKEAAASKFVSDAISRKEDKENIAPKHSYRDPYDSVDNDTFSTLPKPSPLKYQAQVDDEVTGSSFGEGPSVTKPNTSQPLSAKLPPLIPSASQTKASAARTGQSFVIPSMPTEEVATTTITKPIIQNGKVVTHRSRQRPVNHFEGERQEENIYQMIDLLKEKVADLEKINQSTQQTIAHLQRDNDQLATEKREVEARNAQLISEKKEAEARTAQLISDKKEAEARNKETQIAIRDLQQKVADFDLVKGIRSQGERIIAGLQQKVAEHERINTQAQRIIKEIQEDNDQLIRENELLHSAKSEAQHTITSLRSEVSQRDTFYTEKVTNLEKIVDGLKEKAARDPRKVSQRDGLDADATVRPAMPPKDALMEIIESCEADLLHLKGKWSKASRVYEAHDPALGKRKRESTKLDLDNLGKAIEEKSNLIYQLYDVLEGLDD